MLDQGSDEGADLSLSSDFDIMLERPYRTIAKFAQVCRAPNSPAIHIYRIASPTESGSSIEVDEAALGRPYAVFRMRTPR